MTCVIRNAEIFFKGKLQALDVLVENDLISAVGENIFRPDAVVIDAADLCLLPGLTDVHVHLREPGFSYKETIATGTAAAARGGFTCVCAMPNLSPCPDSPEHLETELGLIRRGALVKVFPYCSVTVGEQGRELTDIAALAPRCAGFSDDGRGVQDENMMLTAMEKVAASGSILAAHCEDDSLLSGGYIHDGEYARAHGHRGICSESEWGPIARDVRLAKKTGCRYHVCHVSTKESVDIIRRAKADGVDVTCETAPHYLTLDDSFLQEDGRFKMNPPLRSREDRLALIEGIKDGTIDMIATDHAPHSAEEKSRGLEKSAMGVVGLETAFPVCYTKLVLPGVISFEKLMELMNTGPAKRFGAGGEIAVGKKADLALWDLKHEYEIDPDSFLSMGRATPFKGEKVFGKCLMTMVDGRIVWQENLTER